MLFNSLAFVVFALVFFPIYFGLRGRARVVFCLAASYFFYGWWDWRFLGLLLFSTVLDYSIGLAMAATRVESRRRRLLFLSLAGNLGVLGVFKYFDFFMSSFERTAEAIGLGFSPPLVHLILPVGISFYTFQTLSYTIDLYRRKIETPERDVLLFAAYVSLFPQLVAGPIVRADSLLPQLRTDHGIDWPRIGRGLELVLWGFFLKLCLADTAATVVNPRFAELEAFGSLAHLVGVVCFSFQIYSDFAGYSLIAIGLGRIMGLDFGVNFDRPYFSRSFSEFWGRWHISLSSWLRDYLYIPLGGNRGGSLLTVRNLFSTMLLGGLWHGAGWTFIIWGGLHGFYLALQRALSAPYAAAVRVLRVPPAVSSGILILTVFAATNLAWVFFRAESIGEAVRILHIIAGFDRMTLPPGQQIIGIAKTFMIATVVVAVDAAGTRKSIRDRYFASTPLRIAGCVSIALGIALFGTFEGASFLYFQF